MSHTPIVHDMGYVILQIKNGLASCINGNVDIFFTTPDILNDEGEKLLGIALNFILQKLPCVETIGDDIILRFKGSLKITHQIDTRTNTEVPIIRKVEIEIIFVGANKNNVDEPTVPEFLCEVKEPEPDTSLLSKITRLDIKDAESQLMPRKTLSQWFRSLLVKRNPQPPPIINGEKNAYCGE